MAVAAMTGGGPQAAGWVRPAVAADLPAIVHVVEAAYLPWVPIIGTRPAPLSADHAALLAEGVVFVTGLAELPPAGSLEGLVVLRPEPRTLCIDNVAVHPRVQGRGLGRRLLAFAEAEARRLGLPAMRLYTHERMRSNLRLYTAAGYVETGREDIGAGHLVHLRKPLPGATGA
ncbi:GNAT family N-acetyltransferase [Geodermatophilus sp. CPCC 205506]|uniref:GNAT family N-acetyltransferase n=1 Tax=Geodermatophilus sp. CPCC 205506 TaxID=2936596 RepID=UPI003EED4CB6